MMEKFDSIKGMKVTFFGDRTQPAPSLGILCSKLGLTFVHCCPNKYSIQPEWSELLAKNNEASGGRFIQTDDIEEAAKRTNSRGRAARWTILSSN